MMNPQDMVNEQDSLDSQIDTLMRYEFFQKGTNQLKFPIMIDLFKVELKER